MPVPVNPTRTCTAHGHPVKSLNVQILPSPCGPGFMTSGVITREITRVNFEHGADGEPHFQFGEGNDKLGDLSVVRCEYDGGGVTLIGHNGRRVDLTPNIIGAVTYTYAD